MKAYTRRLRWWAPVAMTLAIGWAYWGFAGGCTPSGSGGGGGGGGSQAAEPGGGATEEPGGEGGTADPGGESSTENLTVNESTCVPLDDQASEFELKVEGVSKEGRVLSYTRRLIMSGDRGAGFQAETEVTADGELVMSIVAIADSQFAEVQIEYGPLVPGLASASAAVEDGVLSGMVDARAIVSMPLDDEFDASTVSLEDGNPSPELGMDADLEEALTELFEVAATTAEGCSAPNGNNVEDVQKVIGTGLKKTGHFSETVETVDCAKCWGKCAATAVGCIAGVSGGCLVTLIGYAPCVVAGLAACAGTEVACFDGCYDGGEGCCPVSCHTAFLVDVCCLEGESCLDPDTGRCCGPGETPCDSQFCCEDGKEECMFDSRRGVAECCNPDDRCGLLGFAETCCNPGDSCIVDIALCCPAGHARCTDKCCDIGQECINNDLVCCDSENVCEDRCCTPPEVCHAGTCCSNVCGSVCCDELSTCIPGQSTCCGFDQDVCGNACCAVGESCVGGTTCCPDARICGGVCCPEGNGCDTVTSTCTPCPNPTDTPCNSGGCCPAGMNCTDNPAVCCPAGQTVCSPSSTNCVPFSNCIG